MFGKGGCHDFAVLDVTAEFTGFAGEKSKFCFSAFEDAELFYLGRFLGHLAGDHENISIAVFGEDLVVFLGIDLGFDGFGIVGIHSQFFSSQNVHTGKTVFQSIVGSFGDLFLVITAVDDDNSIFSCKSIFHFSSNFGGTGSGKSCFVGNERLLFSVTKIVPQKSCGTDDDRNKADNCKSLCGGKSFLFLFADDDSDKTDDHE